MVQSIISSGDLPRLNFPLQKIILKKDKGFLKIFDPLRKKYLVLTPEEYVRQQFVSWLQNSLSYPASLIANEIGIDLNGLKRRCDTVVFNPEGTIKMVIEYKAPDVHISQDTFDQIVRYNLILKADYLVVTNGISLYCCRIDYSSKSYFFLKNIPFFNETAG